MTGGKKGCPGVQQDGTRETCPVGETDLVGIEESRLVPTEERGRERSDMERNNGRGATSGNLY